jgi:hypothetical protein
VKASAARRRKASVPHNDELSKLFALLKATPKKIRGDVSDCEESDTLDAVIF